MMGTRHRFACSACEYAAKVEGGGGAGFAAFVQTFCCPNCRELFDRFYLAGEAEQRALEKVRCKRCKGPVTLWSAGDPCPKCGGAMRDDGIDILWD